MNREQSMGELSLYTPDSAMFYALWFFVFVFIKKEMYGPSPRFQDIKLQRMSWSIKLFCLFSSTEKLRTLKLSKLKGKMLTHSQRLCPVFNLWFYKIIFKIILNTEEQFGSRMSHNPTVQVLGPQQQGVVFPLEKLSPS